MDVVFEGRLTDEVTLKSVLLKIQEKRPSGNLLLRVATAQRDCDGKICIVDGRFITAAIVATSRENGYDAVRKLLSVEEGNFACLRPSAEDSLSIPYSLNIELEKIIPLMPNLPESPNGLHDEKSLLDKVFGSNAFDPIMAEPQREFINEPEREFTMEPRREVLESRPKNANASWQLLQPLTAPNELIEPEPVIEPIAPPVRTIEPISAEELASLHVPRPAQSDHDTKIRPGKRNSSRSPLLMVTAVGILFVMELIAIFYWKPLNAYIAHYTGDRGAQVSHRSNKRNTAQKH